MPALVSHQPTLPRDEPAARGGRTVLHRGSLTCALALQTRLAGLLCGEAKTAPWTEDRETPVRSWDGFELPKADALGVVIGRFLSRTLDRPYNFEPAVGEVGLDCRRTMADHLFVVPRSPWGILTTSQIGEETQLASTISGKTLG